MMRLFLTDTCNSKSKRGTEIEVIQESGKEKIEIGSNALYVIKINRGAGYTEI